jgi:hypothetical protein
MVITGWGSHEYPVFPAIQSPSKRSFFPLKSAARVETRREVLTGIEVMKK